VIFDLALGDEKNPSELGFGEFHNPGPVFAPATRAFPDCSSDTGGDRDAAIDGKR
jgi:hypothetical protein